MVLFLETRIGNRSNKKFNRNRGLDHWTIFIQIKTKVIEKIDRDRDRDREKNFTGTGTGPGPVKKIHRDRDRDQKFFTGTMPGPGPEKSDFADP